LFAIWPFDEHAADIARAKALRDELDDGVARACQAAGERCSVSKTKTQSAGARRGA
jgi:hypothetical protein